MNLKKIRNSGSNMLVEIIKIHLLCLKTVTWDFWSLLNANLTLYKKFKCLIRCRG